MRIKTSRMRKTFSVIFAMLLLFSSVNFESIVAFAEQTRNAGPVAVGPFKNVTHTVQLKEGHEELCKRDLEGELKFDWPEPSTYVDLVIVQDLSGSFRRDIQAVGGAIQEIIDNLNMGYETNDGVDYPKDRVMLTHFRGLHYHIDHRYNVWGNGGIEPYLTWRDYSYYGNYRVGSVYDRNGTTSTMFSNKTDAKREIGAYYSQSQTDSGTPTVDGLVEAQNRYQALTPDSMPYNAPTYEVGGEGRKRETVYLLITDGVANVAKWSNLSDAVRSALIPTYRNTYYDPRYYNSVDDYYNSFGAVRWLSYAKRGTTDVGPFQANEDTAFYEHAPIMTALREEGSKMRNSGGVAGGAAKVVTAFWEDRGTLIGDYGASWLGYMRQSVEDTLKDMSGNNSDNYVTNNDSVGAGNLDAFARDLVASLRVVETPVVDQVNMQATLGTTMKTFEIYKGQRQTGGNVVYNTEPEDIGNVGLDTGTNIVAIMENMEPAPYKIVYTMSEEAFMAEDYKPVTIGMVFEGEEHLLGDTLAIDSLVGNPRNDCDISLTKNTSSPDEDPYPGSQYNELDRKRDDFYYNTLFKFTKKVQNATSSIVLQDEIDPRLEILDAWITARNESAMADAVTGATDDNTLVAEYKGQGENHEGVPALDVTGNKVSYTLPQQPVEIAGIEFPYGGYDGKEYLLSVKVRVREEVTDTQLIDMNQQEPGHLLKWKKGLPNVAEIVIDGEVTPSNEVRAVPPMTQTPSINKLVKRATSAQWRNDQDQIEDANQAFMYSFHIPIPKDTTGYDRLLIEDDLDPVLEFADPIQLRIKYGAPGSNYSIIDEQYLGFRDYTLDNEALGQGKLSITINDREILDAIEGKTLHVQFNAAVKADADLTGEYYDSVHHVMRVSNRASVTVNQSTPAHSEYVDITIPVGQLKINKYFEGNTGQKLEGAVFEIRDKAVGGQARTVTTDERGQATIDGLLPNHSYTVKELTAPDGYLLNPDLEWDIEVDKRGFLTVTKKGSDTPITGDTLNAPNEKPDTPVPEKRLKGANGNFIQPTEENPYKMESLDEEITYSIRLPISSTEAYMDLEVTDTFDPVFSPKWKTAKAYTSDGQGGEVELAGNFSPQGQESFKWRKTSGFDQIKEYVEIRVTGTINKDKLDQLFAGDKNGLMSNTAEVSLNGGPKVASNTVYHQATRGRLAIAKNVADSDGTGVRPMPEGAQASFILYKVVGLPDSEANGETDDQAIEVVTVTGSAPAEVDNLDPGSYYFVETTAPIGYIKSADRVPQEGVVTIPGDGGVVEMDENQALNIKATDPTIQKYVKGDDRPEFSFEDYNIGIGETWQYAVDVNIPETVSDLNNYIVEDEVSYVVDVTEAPVVQSDMANTGTFEADETAQQWLTLASNTEAGNEYSVIKLEIPSQEVVNYRGKTIRIVFGVNNQQGYNFVDEGVLTEGGGLPNTAVLYKQSGDEPREEVGDSTVYIKPNILRDVQFTKVLGEQKLPNVRFKLYHRNGSENGELAQEAFTDNPCDKTTNQEGFIKFKNIQAGEYWLEEITTDASQGILPYEKILVVVSGDPAVANNSQDAVIFKDPNGRVLTGEPIVNIWNNELVKVPVTKTWAGELDDWFTRPSSIQLALYRRGGGWLNLKKL